MEDLNVVVVENRVHTTPKDNIIVLGEDLKFSTDSLRSYLLARWEAVVFDAMVVTAAIEYADRVLVRSALGWGRKFSVRVPVHEPERWSADNVRKGLEDAIGFLTGDSWQFEFVGRNKPEAFPDQQTLDMPMTVDAVIPYSDGMDSRAVAGILAAQLGDGLLRVRVGMKSNEPHKRNGKVVPFAGIPYTLKTCGGHKESSARSRGFKFAFISGLAAYLASSEKVVIPESGQGIIGPALVTVAHAYPDYRNHPRFLSRMEKLLGALLRVNVKYEFPRLWQTKAETLKEFVALPEGSDWAHTKTCWHDSRASSVNGKFRSCGICSACLLRRMSVYAAGLHEEPDSYVVVDLSASSLRKGADPDFKRLNKSFEDYGIAGALSLANFAFMSEKKHESEVTRHSALMAHSLGLAADACEASLKALLGRHAAEWHGFANSLGSDSFINHWVRGAVQ